MIDGAGGVSGVQRLRLAVEKYELSRTSNGCMRPLMIDPVGSHGTHLRPPTG